MVAFMMNYWISRNGRRERQLNRSLQLNEMVGITNIIRLIQRSRVLSYIEDNNFTVIKFYQLVEISFNQLFNVIGIDKFHVVGL